MKYFLFSFFLLPLVLSAQLVGDKQTGLGSYYSAEYDGAETSYNVTYNKNELVAAHKSYPFNSTVRVRNEENGKTVVVRIIDKGPFIRGRIVELSERAAADLGMIGKRTIPVELTLLSTPTQGAVRAEQEIASEPIAVVPVASPTTAEREVVIAQPIPDPEQPTRRADVAPAPQARTAQPAAQSRPAPTVTAVRETVKAAELDKLEYSNAKTFGPGLYKINLLEPPTGNFGVQVGSFSTLESAMDKIVQLQNKFFDNILLHRIDDPFLPTTYKVILGPFVDQASAKNYASDLKSRYQMAGFTVVLAESRP